MCYKNLLISWTIYIPPHNFWYTTPIFMKLSNVCRIKMNISKKFQVNLTIIGNFTDQNTKIESGLLKCQYASITMANLYQSVRLKMDYIWVNFDTYIANHYWDIVIFQFLGSILICSVNCTIVKKIGQYPFFASHTLLFPKIYNSWF